MAADLSPELAAKLYTADPQDFLSVRTALAGEAKQDGNLDLARAVTTHRKPTVGAWVVNRQVHVDPSVVERLLDLGSRLRAAHEQLDASTLRDLSAERRRLVTDTAAAALAAVGRADAGSGLRDDVTDTFDAAVADPQIAARLGRLTRGEKWSGFGVAVDTSAGAPELTVLPGGRGGRRGTRTPAKSAAEPPAAPKVDQAAARRARRARDKAAEAFATAEADLQRSADAEHAAAEAVHDLAAQLDRLQAQLAAAERDHERARQDLRAAGNRRREARSALDRAERQSVT